MKFTNKKTEQRARRHARIRSKISGTSEMPRLSVFKSNRYVSAQLIDDVKGETLVAASTQNLKGKGMLEKARNAGKAIAEAAVKKNIKKVAFDRGGFIYTGRVRAFAEGAREGGLEF
jgi:large subunit ribosomal protein L18